MSLGAQQRHEARDMQLVGYDLQARSAYQPVIYYGRVLFVDRANTGMHVLELTGAARRVARFQ